jgi:hypothetical protein
METLIRKLIDARNKELILQYLRYHINKRLDALNVRNEVFGEPFSYQKVQNYFQDMVKDGLVDSVKDSSIIWNKYDSNEFIESGGYLKQVFKDEKLKFNESDFKEAHHKDLILAWLKADNSFAWWRPDDLKGILFPDLDKPSMTYYIDKLSTEGYLKRDNIAFQYYKDSDKFLEDSGYLGQYLLKLKKQSEQESEEALILQEKRKKYSDRKEYNENFNTTVKYYILKVGIWIGIGLLLLVVLLTLIGFIPREQAIQGFKWFISIFK